MNSNLVDFARTKEEAALKHLAKLFAECRNQEDKLALLETYRNDYEMRLVTVRQSGMDGAALANYLHFMRQLDLALKQQHEQTNLSRLQLQAGREHWDSAQRRLRSFESLLSRRIATNRSQEARRDRVQEDEIAARRTTLPTLQTKEQR